MAAAGEIGMSEREFYTTSPGYFAALWKGYERKIQHEYEVARYIGFHAIQPLKASVKSWRINKYSDLGRFPWEVLPASDMIDLKAPEYEAVFSDMDKLAQQHAERLQKKVKHANS